MCTVPMLLMVLGIAAHQAGENVVRITGRVQDTSCHPIPGARVSGSYPLSETITREDGRFELRVPLTIDAAGSNIESVQLNASIAGFRLTVRGLGRLQSDLRRFQTLTLDIAGLAHVDPVLPVGQHVPSTVSVPEPGLRGEVLTSHCQPIGGADLRLRTPDGFEFRATSDARGRFAFETAPPGTYDLEVDAQGFIHVHRNGTKIAPEGTPPVRLLMDDGANGVVDVISDK